MPFQLVHIYNYTTYIIAYLFVCGQILYCSAIQRTWHTGHGNFLGICYHLSNRYSGLAIFQILLWANFNERISLLSLRVTMLRFSSASIQFVYLELRTILEATFCTLSKSDFSSLDLATLLKDRSNEEDVVQHHVFLVNIKSILLVEHQHSIVCFYPKHFCV